MTFLEPMDQTWVSQPILRQATHLLSAVRTNNLGDDIQTLALRDLINFTGEYIDRDSPGKWPKESLVPLCGWFGWGRLPTPATVIVVGFHCQSGSRGNIYDNRQWLGEQVAHQGFPAMCRDISTRDFLRFCGIEAEFGGCVTLTLPRYDGPRDGPPLSIDNLAIEESLRDQTYTQLMGELREKTAEERMEVAAARLELMRNAVSVESSRLHVVLPCIAMGTPVQFNKSDNIQWPERFSGYWAA